MPRYSVLRFVLIPEGQLDAQIRCDLTKELMLIRFTTPLVLLKKIGSLPGEKDE